MDINRAGYNAGKLCRDKLLTLGDYGISDNINHYGPDKLGPVLCRLEGLTINNETEGKQMEFKIGTKVYNHGDMANQSHFGTVTKMNGNTIKIRPDEPDIETYSVETFMFSPEFKGHCGTRLVLAAAYDKWFNEQINKQPSHL